MWNSTLFFVVVQAALCGTFLGTYEQGEAVPFTYLAADPSTGAPTEPLDLSFRILNDGKEIGSGEMYAGVLGTATGVYEATACECGTYTVLMSGLVGGVTRQQLGVFDLVTPGAGPDALAEAVQEVSRELQIVTRENSRSRLWYAQSVIDTATRKVPADLPSHLEVQLKYSDIPGFATPVETFYRVFFYPDCATATRACREEKHPDPPSDGTFYALPNESW